MLTLLKTRRFLPLFITQFFGALNDNIFKNALVILITYRLATAGINSQILVVLAAGIFILPFFIFSATAGQLADKYMKANLIIVIKIFEILLMVLATIGFYLQNISLLMLVLFALGTHAAFFGPLKYAILPEQLQEDELIAGNGLIEAGTFLAILFGTILGGVFILHPQGETIISSILLIFSAIGLYSSWNIPKNKQYTTNLKVNLNFVNETFKLINYSKSHREIFLSILGISWFWLVGATFLAEFPTLSKDILHANESIVTLFLTVFSIGLALGSLCCNRLLKGKVHAGYVPFGVIGITIFTIDLYFAINNFSLVNQNGLINVTQFLSTTNGWHISIDLLLNAFCGGIYTVPLYAIIQQRAEGAHRARVIASNNVMNAFFMVIASISTMLMLKIGFSVNGIFLTIALVNGLVAVYICKLLPDDLIKFIFKSILSMFYRVEVKGIQNYYNAGERVVIIANHTSFIDALLLGAFLPDKLNFAVNTFIAKKWWIKLFLRLVDAYSINPTNPMALKSLIEFIKTDKRCVIFPEGRLTTTGSLMKIYEGPGLVADKANAKLLTVRIDGAEFTPFSRLHGKVRIKLFPKITITIFPPKNLNILSEIKGRKRRQQIGLDLYDTMTEAMFDSKNIHKTLFELLIDAKKTYGSNHEIIEDIDRIPCSYQQLVTRAFILGGIIAKSTQESEYVGVLLPNAISNVITFFALQAFGRVPAILNFSTGIKNVLSATQTAQIKIIYTSRKFVELAKLNDLIDALQSNNIKIVYLENVRKDLKFTNKILGVIRGRFPRITYRMLNENINPNDPAVLLFTSGSEGTPKGVVLSHVNLQVNCNQLGACVDFNPSDIVFNALPLFHSFGLTGGMLLPVLSGIKFFLYPSPLHFRIIPELVYDINATIFFGTDTFLAGYAKYAHPYDFYSIRYIFAGAEKLKDETRLIWSEKFGIRIFEGYGTTETSPVLATNTALQNKIGTVGRLLPGISYQLKPVPGITEGGILLVSGLNVMKGYLLSGKEGIIEPPQDGWYETGDVVTIDDSGFLTIKGRIKRFAKIAGEMISLSMIEQNIFKLWPDYQHAAINFPDPKKGEQIILATTNPKASREELVSFAKTNQLGEINIPKKIIFQENIPLLGSGKIDYASLRDIIVNLTRAELLEEVYETSL